MKYLLLVEPNQSVAGVIKRYIEKDKNIKVAVASSAQDAIHAADAQKPDLVVLELAIPMHNGFAFLHELRSYSDWSEIPVIVHSHLAQNEAAISKSWKMLGAVEYFYKPTTSLARLKAGIDKVLER